MTRRLLPKLCSLIVLSFAQILHAQAGAAIPPPIFLYPNGAPGQWPSGAPGARGDTEADKPRMYAFLPKTRSTSAAVLVIPGGGYEHVAMGHEGFQLATWLNAQGMAAFVLDYRVAPYQFPIEIDDGRRAMRLIRAHADEYGIDPDAKEAIAFAVLAYEFMERRPANLPSATGARRAVLLGKGSPA